MFLKLTCKICSLNSFNRRLISDIIQASIQIYKCKTLQKFHHFLFFLNFQKPENFFLKIGFEMIVTPSRDRNGKEKNSFVFVFFWRIYFAIPGKNFQHIFILLFLFHTVFLRFQTHFLTFFHSFYLHLIKRKHDWT